MHGCPWKMLKRMLVLQREIPKWNNHLLVCDPQLKQRWIMQQGIKLGIHQVYLCAKRKRTVFFGGQTHRAKRRTWNLQVLKMCNSCNLCQGFAFTAGFGQEFILSPHQFSELVGGTDTKSQISKKKKKKIQLKSSRHAVSLFRAIELNFFQSFEVSYKINIPIDGKAKPGSYSTLFSLWVTDTGQENDPLSSKILPNMFQIVEKPFDSTAIFCLLLITLAKLPTS